MGLLLGLALGAVAFVGALAFGKRRAREAARSSAPASAAARIIDADRAKQKTESLGLFAGDEVQMEWAAAGGAAGGAVAGLAFGAAAGPVGAVIGFGLGLFAGAFISAVGQPSYARIVRDGIAGWLGDSGYPTSAAHVDALLFRDAIVGSVLWVHEDGRAAVEIVRYGEMSLSLFPPGARTGPKEPLLPGYAGTQSRQNMAGFSDGMLDGPDRRKRMKAWKAQWRPGGLWPLVFGEPRDSWRTPGYVWFGAVWPLVSQTDPIVLAASLPLPDGWSKVVVTRDNVEAVAVATFDRAAGIGWTKAEAAP